jgi:hypothetical protein
MNHEQHQRVSARKTAAVCIKAALLYPLTLLLTEDAMSGTKASDD